MKRIKLVLKSLTYIGLVLISSCATGDPAVRQASRQFQSRNTYTQGIVGGALIGAGIGALIGAGNNKAVEGALIGGAVGAGAGGAYAHHKVEQRQAYAQQEENLKNAIKNARSTREAARKFNDVLSSKIGDALANRETLDGTLADSRRVLISVNRELATQRTTLRQAKAANLSHDDRGKLSEEISGLEQQRGRLEKYINTLAPASKDL